MVRAVAVVALAAAGLLLSASPATAHADIVASSPSDGAVLDVSPRQIVVQFTEPVEAATAAINIETAMRERVQATRPSLWKNDPTALVVPVTDDLGGSYVVFWRVTGTDSHVITGAFSFAVFAAGEVASPAPGVARGVTADPNATRPGLLGALTLARGVTYVAMSALVGGAFLLVVVWPAGARIRRMRRLLWVALVVAAMATGLSASIAHATATGRSLGAVVDPTIWFESTRTHFGWVAAVRLALLVLAGFLLADLDSGVGARSRWWLIPAAAVGVALVRTPGLFDHGATASPLESVAYLLHMGGIAIWVGGLLVIVAVVVPARSEIEDLRALLMRFSAVATGALVVVVGSGVVLASPLLDNWRAVPSSEYGQLFLTKLVLVAAGVAFAARVRSWLRGSRGSRTAVRNLVTEIALVLSVIAVTSVLVARNPSLAPASTSQSTSITQKGISVASPSS